MWIGSISLEVLVMKAPCHSLAFSIFGFSNTISEYFHWFRTFFIIVPGRTSLRGAVWRQPSWRITKKLLERPSYKYPKSSERIISFVSSNFESSKTFLSLQKEKIVNFTIHQCPYLIHCELFSCTFDLLAFLISIWQLSISILGISS